MMWLPLPLLACAKPFSAQLSDSLPLDVKNTSLDLAPIREASVSRASATAFSAWCPIGYSEDGLPNSVVR